MKSKEITPTKTLEPCVGVTVIIHSKLNLVVKDLKGDTSTYKLGQKVYDIVSKIDGVGVYTGQGGWGGTVGSLLSIVNIRNPKGGYVKDIGDVLIKILTQNGLSVTTNQDLSTVYMDHFAKFGYNLTLVFEDGVGYLFDKQSLAESQEMISIPVVILDEMTNTLARYSKILAGYKEELLKKGK